MNQKNCNKEEIELIQGLNKSTEKILVFILKFKSLHLIIKKEKT
jgi:hypothetical protein